MAVNVPVSKGMVKALGTVRRTLVTRAVRPLGAAEFLAEAASSC
jgi:hypothetical protein